VKPIVYGHETPRGADAFEVEWPISVDAHAPFTIADHPYLSAIERYSNIEPIALESIVALDTRTPWGDWFDPCSCTDRTVLLIDRETREGALLAFSHSD
jgi:hypothetical protein